MPQTSAVPIAANTEAKATTTHQSKLDLIKSLFMVNPSMAVDDNGHLHPDHMHLDSLVLEVRNKLANAEQRIGVVIPKWFKNMAEYSCRYMQNTHPSRWLALGNETAEAFRAHVKELFPWLEKPFYYGAWALTIFYTIMRNLMVSIRGGGVACVKNTVHDLFAEAIVPPLIVRYTNLIQENISKALFGKNPNHIIGQFIHWTRPFTSMLVGNKMMRYLDRAMVNVIPKLFKKLPVSWAQGINKLFKDWGAILSTKLFKSTELKPIHLYSPDTAAA